MAKPTSPFLYDELGNQYPRRDQAQPQAIREFKQARQAFYSRLRTGRADAAKALPPGLPARLRRLRLALWTSQELAAFYEPYAGLSWDNQLRYDQSRLEAAQLPEIIAFYEGNWQELVQAKERYSRLDRQKQAEASLRYRQQCREQKTWYRSERAKLKAKRRQRLISEKALHNGSLELRKKMQEARLSNSFAMERMELRDIIINRRYALSTGLNRKLKILQSNISDLRRRTPSEPRLQQPWFAFTTGLLPGLGQLLNRQYLKAAIFGLASLFIYFVAIPYALGYGNYQGTGISGLISLAQGARRVDRSLIFMIEGIVAIFLVLIAIALLALNFNDVYKTQKEAIRGIRPRNWFETASRIKNEGFPYLVCSPALLITLFLVIVPITTAILLSFTGMNPQNQAKFPWVGLANYQAIAMGRGLAGQVFWLILGWTLVWTAISTTLAILTGFGLALLSNQERIRGKAVFRAIYLLPWAVPAFITIMFFSIMFAPDGALTVILSNLFNARVHIKTDPLLSRITLILLQTWLGSSYIFLLATGVLQAIPGDLYEAAQIDGASAWQKLFKITIPIVLFQTAPLLVGQYTFNFNNFSIIWLFNSGGPFNPSRYGNLAGGTDILISYIYKLTMQNQYQAIGAAITIVISLGLMLFAFIGFKNSKAFKEERL